MTQRNSCRSFGGQESGDRTGLSVNPRSILVAAKPHDIEIVYKNLRRRAANSPAVCLFRTRQSVPLGATSCAHLKAACRGGIYEARVGSRSEHSGVLGGTGWRRGSPAESAADGARDGAGDDLDRLLHRRQRRRRWARDRVTWAASPNRERPSRLALPRCFRLPQTQITLEGGFVGGGQIGCNYQMNSFVLGVEADAQYTGMRAAVTRSRSATPMAVGHHRSRQHLDLFESNWLATFRGRAGFTTGPVLFYITGGAAFADVTFNDQICFGATALVPGCNTSSAKNNSPRLDRRRRHRVDVRGELDREGRISLRRSRNDVVDQSVFIGLSRGPQPVPACDDLAQQSLRREHRQGQA